MAAANSFTGDRAWESGQQDWLGLRSFARETAKSLLAQGSNSGLVIGLEGQWGSGKSSLLNMVVEELQAGGPGAVPLVVQFRPWLIGSRDGLLNALFNDLAKAIANSRNLNGTSSGQSRKKVEELGEKVRSFGKRLSGAGKLVSFAGNFVPGLTAIGGMISQASESLESEKDDVPLSELKDDLVNSLRGLNHQIIVTIDDVDRLEPPEVLEIIRLVRAVADFPNVTYVLCYDQDVLSKAISAATGLSNGGAYLEKIIQVQVSIPYPEPFQLRHWFTSELSTFATSSDDDELQRLMEVIDHEGGRRLVTPRSVVRTLNGIRLFWPALLAAGADLADLVWLQLIRASNIEYYKWIERYCNTFSVLASGRASIHGDEIQKDWAELVAILKRDGVDIQREAYFVKGVLPGIGSWSKEEEAGSQIFQDTNRAVDARTASDRRLKSPDHSRLYFALAQASFAPTASDFQTLWSAADRGPAQLGAFLLDMHRPGDIAGVSKAVVMLERLASAYNTDLSSERCTNLLLAFSSVLDEAARRMGLGEFYGPAIWNQADNLIPLLLGKIPVEGRLTVIKQAFNGDALGWLTSVLRRETFAQGRWGDRRRPQDEWWFTSEELNVISQTLLSRYRRLSLKELLQQPQPLSLLFAWQQSGDEAGPQQLIYRATEADLGLIEVLEALTGRVRTSPGGEVHTLSKSNLESFINFDESRRRISALANGDGELAARAASLHKAFEAGDRF